MHEMGLLLGIALNTRAYSEINCLHWSFIDINPDALFGFGLLTGTRISLNLIFEEQEADENYRTVHQWSHNISAIWCCDVQLATSPATTAAPTRRAASRGARFRGLFYTVTGSETLIIEVVLDLYVSPPPAPRPSSPQQAPRRRPCVIPSAPPYKGDTEDGISDIDTRRSRRRRQQRRRAPSPLFPAVYSVFHHRPDKPAWGYSFRTSLLISCPVCLRGMTHSTAACSQCHQWAECCSCIRIISRRPASLNICPLCRYRV